MFLNRIQIAIIVILIPIGLLYLYANSQNTSVWDLFRPSATVIHIEDTPIRVEIADSDQERITGLSGRESLEGINGLLFVFAEADYHSIWMKDMRFPIDIIWISEDLMVIGVEKNVTPETYPRLFRPSSPAKYVLETDIHYADTFGIRAGQKVTLPNEYLDK
jgi:uncharacterized membrane protein (UPF0127 family)